MKYDIKFKPLFKSSYAQTFAGSMINFSKEVGSKTHIFPLPVGDKLALEVSSPSSWKEEDPIIFLVHGLCGSHKSHYMKRMSKRFYHRGMKTVRINLRGCGSGKGLAKKIYHGGSTPDVEAVLSHYRDSYPAARFVLLGYSLGANLSLKLIGDLKEMANKLVSGVIAIGPPVDLIASAKRFTSPENKVYERSCLKTLKKQVKDLHKTFPDLPKYDLPEDLSLGDLDEYYVAPAANCESAQDYYRKYSSMYVIEQIAIPTRILFAKDDPIIESSSLDHLNLPDHIHVCKTEHGGHIGYIGQNVFKEFRWLDLLILKWVDEILLTTKC